MSLSQAHGMISRACRHSARRRSTDSSVRPSHRPMRRPRPASSGRASVIRLFFRHLMFEVPHAATLDDLLAEARRFNEQNLSPPLSLAEVEKTARQVWHYEETGQNWIGHGQGGVALNAAVVDDLLRRAHGEDALALLVKLKRSHGARVSPFAIVSKAMARDKLIAGWKDPRGYTRARRILQARGLIRMVSRARRDAQERWKPAKYKFTKPGTNNAPNITTHPSPPHPLI